MVIGRMNFSAEVNPGIKKLSFKRNFEMTMPIAAGL
jgi:hypothetical protein